MLSRYPPGTQQDLCRTPFRQVFDGAPADAALKYSILGDIALIDREEVETLIARGADGPQLLR